MVSANMSDDAMSQESGGRHPVYRPPIDHKELRFKDHQDMLLSGASRD